MVKVNKCLLYEFARIGKQNIGTEGFGRRPLGQWNEDIGTVGRRALSIKHLDIEHWDVGHYTT